MKFKITNTSGSSEKGSRNIFVMDAGKKLEPGHVCYANRILPSTRQLEKSKSVKIEEGDFTAPPLFKTEPVQPPLPPTENQKESQSKAAAQAAAMDERMAAAAAKEAADKEAAEAAQAAADKEAADKMEADKAAETVAEDAAPFSDEPSEEDEEKSDKRGRRGKSKK